MKQLISDVISAQERAFYHLRDARLERCRFEGAEDGESALKESGDIEVESCYFALRYPLWHARNFTVTNSIMTDTCRAPLWYAHDGKIVGCEINGVKCLRECGGVEFEHCEINSDEFGWKCDNIKITNCEIKSGYLFFDSAHLELRDFRLDGKYSFQYTRDGKISDSRLLTKDAFWHSKNLVVENSVIIGEYLGWYSENLTFINCKIQGTQPLCYCENLRLINCEMIDADLAFEYSSVQADIKGEIMSVKNPKSGVIVADAIGEIHRENPVIPCVAKIKIR